MSKHVPIAKKVAKATGMCFDKLQSCQERLERGSETNQYIAMETCFILT